MVGWHHQLNGHEFAVHGVTGSDMTEVTEHTHTFPLAFFFFALKIVYKLLLANRVI